MHLGYGRRLAVVVLMLAVVGAGCSTTKDVLIVSGETLKASDKQFRIVAAAYVDGCKAVPRQIPEPECATFRTFGQQWNKGFPLAADLWLVAKDAGDSASVSAVSKVISDLVTELTKFTLKVLAMVAPAAGGK